MNEPSSSDGSSPGTTTERGLGLALIIAIGVTVLQPFVPFGNWIAWPFILISTVVHELGHGLTAWIVGGDFVGLKLSTDASGVAFTRPPTGRWPFAAIAAGGLIGPAVLASLGFTFGRTVRNARLFLVATAVLLLVVLIRIKLYDAFGYGMVGTLFLASGAIAFFAKPWWAQFTLILLSAQMASSVFIRGDYLFVKYVDGDPSRPSDVEQIASQLFLPYWFWGLVCGAISVGVLIIGLRAVFGSTGKTAPTP